MLGTVRPPRPSEYIYQFWHHMEISRDATFDEDVALKKSRKCQPEETFEEVVAPRAAELMK